MPSLVRHYGEPYADPSAIPTYYVSRETRKYVTVALNGDGGDESFVGYERHVAMKFAEIYRRLPSAVRSKLIEPGLAAIPASTDFRNRLTRLQRFLSAASLSETDRYFRWMSTFNPEEKAKHYTPEFLERSSSNVPIEVLEPYFNHDNGHGIVDATLHADLMTYLPNDLLVKVDIASMANSLEARSPFLDHVVIEFAASLPEHIKQSGRDTKSLLKKVAAELVPSEVIYRPKMGFAMPIKYWLATDLRELTRDTLLSDRFAKRGVVRKESTELLIKEQESDVRDNSWKLWTLLMLELWFREFID